MTAKEFTHGFGRHVLLPAAGKASRLVLGAACVTVGVALGLFLVVLGLALLVRLAPESATGMGWRMFENEAGARSARDELERLDRDVAEVEKRPPCPGRDAELAGLRRARKQVSDHLRLLDDEHRALHVRYRELYPLRGPDDPTK